MREYKFIRKFIWIMAALGASLALLWLVFYFITNHLIHKNMHLQAETASEAIMTDIEEKLTVLEENATDIAALPGADLVMGAEGNVSFYDYGASFSKQTRALFDDLGDADNIVLYNSQGAFYRVKGTLSNTLLRRAFYMFQDADAGILAVTSNKNSYIGTFKATYEHGAKKGYVFLLLEETRLERMLGIYNDLDYLKMALMSGEKLLCSNAGLVGEDIVNAADSALFYKEKEIGLSGFKLVVYCENNISAWLSKYFRVALPLTLIILAGIIYSFVYYLKRHMADPINTVIMGTLQNGEAPLPHTGEEYFDGFVDYVNQMMERIREADRTFVLLLKKQISAHFTVNTLYAVRALISKGEKSAAAHICDGLSLLFRYANAGEENVSLLEEFYVLEQYVGIMQTRYPDLIEADFEVEDSLAEMYIPRMLIQPIVENAIVHGLAGKKGRVEVWAETTGQTLVIWVRDDGKGMEEEELVRLRENIYHSNPIADKKLESVALRNIQRRIKLVCGEEYGIEISSKRGAGTKVAVRLPILE